MPTASKRRTRPASAVRTKVVAAPVMQERQMYVADDKLTDNKWLNLILDNFGTGLLIAAAFLLGVLFTEVRYLKKGVGVAGTAPAVGAAQQAPTQPQDKPLTDEQWKSILAVTPALETGSKDAKVTMVEFTDYQCPFCSRYFNDTQGKLNNEYVKTGKVKVLMYDLPLVFHPNAKPAALAARCVGEQGKYELMHNELFKNQAEWTPLTGDALTAKFAEYARTAGANAAKVTACIAEGRYNKVIDESIALASKVGANGTPSFFIEKEAVIGAQPYENFKSVIDKAL